MAETVTINKPAPILTGSLTAFLNEIDKLGKGAVPLSQALNVWRPCWTPTISTPLRFFIPATSNERTTPS